MRSVLLVFLFCVGLVCSTPVDRERDRDVEYVDAGDSRRGPEVRDYDGVDPSLFRPIGDDGFDSDEDDFYGFPQRPSFPGNDEYLRRLQQQLTMMRRILRNWFNRPIAPPRFPPGFFGPSDFGNFSDLPSNYDNSTYTTKNINGTIVYVNETIKKVDNNESSFVFHVKTVQLRPENETAGSDDGLTVIEGEQVDLAGEGGQSSDASTTEAPVVTSSESSDASPSDSESPAVTTESAATVSQSPSSTSEDPTANDVNLARRFRRSLAQ